MELIEIDPATFDSICERAASGESTAKILKLLNIRVFDFYLWMGSDPVRSDRYERARQARSEGLVDEIIEISDTENDAQRARNRIDARRWYASKMLPGKYGDRLDISVTGQVDLKAAIADGAKRVLLRPMSDQPQVTDAEFVELPTPNGAGTTDCGSVKPLPLPAKPKPDPFS